jgi:hypothetical protein
MDDLNESGAASVTAMPRALREMDDRGGVVCEAIAGRKAPS